MKGHQIVSLVYQICFRTILFHIQGVPTNNLTPMKNCPGGVQGNHNWMPGLLEYNLCAGFELDISLGN